MDDTVSYDYDDIGRWKSVTPQGGEAVIHDYDNLNRLTFVKPGTRTFTYVYPSTGSSPLPDSLTRPDGSFTLYHYDDNLKRLWELINKNSSQVLINSDAFTYNAQDLRDSETVTNGAPITNFTANLTSYSYICCPMDFNEL